MHSFLQLRSPAIKANTNTKVKYNGSSLCGGSGGSVFSGFAYGAYVFLPSYEIRDVLCLVRGRVRSISIKNQRPILFIQYYTQ